MRSAEEVIAALECFVTKQRPCKGCAFNPVPGMIWAYGCKRGEREIVTAVRELLKECERNVDNGDNNHGEGPG